jgi:hypothetical protein
MRKKQGGGGGEREREREEEQPRKQSLCCKLQRRVLGSILKMGFRAKTHFFRWV